MRIARKPKKERIKTTILFSLVILSVIQIGIHWNQQTQGFPFSFLLDIFGGRTSQQSVQLDPAEYFLPIDVTVSKNSFQQWVFSENNPYYQEIWTDVRQNYIPEILSKKPDKTYSKDLWPEILSQSCTRIDFSINYPKSMLSWFMDNQITSNQVFNGIKSIAIMPQENVNLTVNTLYVYDESMVYMYHLDIKGNARPKEYYSSLPDNLQSEVFMSAIGQSFPDYRAASDNIPIYVAENSTKPYQTINVKIPDAIDLDPASDNLERVQESILLNQKDSLTAKHLHDDNTAVFSDIDNVYKLDSHGVLLYQYLPQDNTAIGDARTAFENAVSFIELRKNLIGNVQIVLSGYEKKDNYYTFKFNYMIDGTIIQITDMKNNGSVSSPAIQITASAKRILNCRWVIREFSGNGDYKNYKVSFTDLMDMIMAQTPKLYSDLYITEDSSNEKNRDPKFEDIKIGYSFDVAEDSVEPLAPSWLYEISGTNYKLRLQAGGED